MSIPPPHPGALPGSSQHQAPTVWLHTVAALLALVAFGWATGPALSQTAGLPCTACPGSVLPVFVCAVAGPPPSGRGCQGFNNCQTPTANGPTIEVIPQAPGSFEARLVVGVTTPWNSQPDIGVNGTLDAFWAAGATPQSPTPSLCENASTDLTFTYLRQTHLTCSGAPYTLGTYALRAQVCGGPGTNCGRWADVGGMVFTVTAEMLGCPVPRVQVCATDACSACRVGVDVGGAPAELNEKMGSPALGPGAVLRYAGGGAGGSGLPGSTEWNLTLGRYWSHDHAERIVADPDDTHVWWITRFASFREFTDGDGDGFYEIAVPSDEYRTLAKTPGGWELTELDGTVHAFDAGGRWVSTTDRNGNATVGHYDASGKLDRVSFPDGRSETYGYHPPESNQAGKLATITEVGIDGTSTLPWAYTWTGDDLVRVDRPDGTAVELAYQDPRHPGTLTQMDLLGTAGGRRIERAWQYDERGSVVATWRGAVTPGANGPEPAAQAVELNRFAFDDPALPTRTTVTDPLGRAAIYQVGRDPASRATRVTAISGDCPVCGSGPNQQLEYADPVHPMRVTRQIDGRGHSTVFEYDAHGQVVTRIDALATPEERTTTWEYDPTYPALVTAVEQLSVTGGPEVRRLSLGRDAKGNLLTRTLEGVEAGAMFFYTTTFTYEPTGQAMSIDPPGLGTADVTSFTYDPARGGLLPLTRTDPLVGTTSFGYDPFNRRTSITDPNGVETVTEVDALDRVRRVIQKGETAAGDLVTEHQYDELGDLLRTVLPRGNVVEYGYDTSGRLVSIERKPDLATPGERTVWTLDGAGNRIREQLQAWDGAAGAFRTSAETRFDYSTRCHPDRVVRAPGTAEESVTEYVYDCNGNLSQLWDANHPRLDPATGLETPPTEVYGYDPLDRLVSVTETWGGAGGGDALTRYTYDHQDHLTGVTDAEGNLTTYRYSDRDLLTEEASPVSGTTTFVYDPHGELAETTDARGVVVTREVDALDRVTAVHYPAPASDTRYVYDDPAVPFSLGRLTATLRHGTAIDYRYDRFGRLTQDGELTYAYDANGDRVEIGYPGGVVARFTHDFADRPASLEVQVGPGPPQPVVTAASYLPSGPLASLTLGNGTAESRSYDLRYVPTRLELSAPHPRRWSFTADGLGNLLEVTETAGCLAADLLLSNQTVTAPELFQTCVAIEAGPAFAVEAPGEVTFRAGTRIVLHDGFSVGTGARFSAEIDPSLAPEMRQWSYRYQDVQSFLTGATGPWGEPAWSYDRIGNRLTETRDGATDTYSYQPNAVAGNTPLLKQITLPVGGTRDYLYGPAGHLTQVTAGANQILWTSDDEGRLSRLERPPASAAADFLYDGRSFLTRASDPTIGTVTRPLYSSEGLLYALRRQSLATAPEEPTHLFYFSGRPVAQLHRASGADTWTFLATDPLGTPQVATDLSGTELWAGPFEPFGRDPLEGTPAGALEKGLFLRLPGQWDDGLWGDAALGAGVFYNVYRWYQPATGTYTRSDPAGLIRSNLDLYGYALHDPVRFVDPVGLATCVVISAATVFELGDLLFAFGDHSALLITGPCQPSESCSSPAPLLYDPAGGYSLEFPGSGTAQILSREIPGWSTAGFFDYHCNYGSDFLEVYCFHTTCCQEEQISERVLPMGFAGCALGVGGAIRGVGPFSDLGGTATPAILRRGMNRLLQEHSGAGATTWTYTCPRSADR